MKDKLEIGLQEALVSVGPNKGLLKKNCPPMNTYGSAVWNAIQSYSNPYKVGIGQMLFMDADTRGLYEYVREVGKSVNLRNFDRDANVLRELGIF